LTTFKVKKFGQNRKLPLNARKKCANHHQYFLRMNFVELNCTHNSNNFWGPSINNTYHLWMPPWHIISTVQEVRLEFGVGSQQLVLTVFIRKHVKIISF